MAAVARLHNHILKEQEALGKAAEGKSKGKGKAKQAQGEGVVLWARQVSGEGMHLKKWRLILRNLPFDVRTSSFVAGIMRLDMSPFGLFHSETAY
jgi:nucleolar protein 4